jgi:recombination protein RecR
MKYPNSLIQLIRELSRLPGVGPKSAQRLAFHLFASPQEEVESLAASLLEAKRDLHLCPTCFNITDAPLCGVCSDGSRDQRLICVVEEPGDVIAIERSGEFAGLYHVLHGALSPMNGVGPEQLKIGSLVKRVQASVTNESAGESNTQAEPLEVILATATTTEGEATAMYVQRQLEPLGAVVSRIAYGLPVGGALEYADEVTLGRAISGRQPVR